MHLFLRTGKSLWTAAVLCAGLCLGGVGCQNALHDDNIALHQQNRELQSKLSETNAKLQSAPDPNSVASMQAELAAREAKIRDLERSLNEPRPAAFPQTPAPAAAPFTPAAAPLTPMPGIEVRRDEAAGTVTVNLPGDVLFSRGQTVLTESAKVTLNKVVKALKNDYSGKLIRVEGHTDSDPIVHSKWKSNQELSKARAEAVARYVESQGVSASKVSTKGWGADKPRGPDKRVNRRVEIVVLTREPASASLNK